MQLATTRAAPLRRKSGPTHALALALLLAPGPAAAPQGEDFAAMTQRALAFAAQQLDATADSVATDRYPSTTGSSGSWSTTSASSWTSGFFPGALWLTFEWSADPLWSARGTAWLGALEDEQYDTSTHDVGFKIFPSFGDAYRLTGHAPYLQVVLTGAGSLATRYSPTVGAIRSWNGPTSGDFRVIIDNMMNLEILFFGARSGGASVWYDMAVSHALKTRAEHVRPDGSTYQLVNYDPVTGAVQEKGTHQGYGPESTWSRGQAWALYGFTLAYRESGDARFLETARATADYFLAHLPADSVPYWDLDLPSTAGEPRDSSAAAIAAAGLLELAHLEPLPERCELSLEAARAILVSLASPAYLAEGTSSASILLHGTQNRPDDRYDTGLIYGDYYFVQALLRHRGWFGLAPVAEPIQASTGTGAPLVIALRASDGQECELAFAIVDPPAHGSLGALIPEPCVPGTPNRDLARVTYVPAPGFAGADSFTFHASDGVNTSNVAVVSLAVLSGGGEEHVFTSTADTKAKSTSPSSNYGSEDTLRLRGGDPQWRSYLRFDPSAFAGPVTAARLRLWVTTGSNDGGSVYSLSSSWTENGLTWSNAPPMEGAPLASAGAVTTGTWVEYDVTPAVLGDGPVAFGLLSYSTTSAYFSSREGAHPPELVLTTGSRTPPVRTSRPPTTTRTW